MKNVNKQIKTYNYIEYKDTIKEYFFEAERKYSDNIAYIKKDNDGNHINITFKQLKQKVCNVGTFLLSNHHQEDKVVIIAKNSYEWCLSYITLLCSGIIAIPLDSGLKEPEIENSLLRALPTTIITDTKKLPMIENIIERNDVLKNVKVILTEGDDTTKEISTLEDIEKLAEGYVAQNPSKLEEFENMQIDPDATKVLLFTSGTTSNPKIVQMSNKNFCCDVRGMQSLIKVTPEDRSLAFLPLHHTFGSTGILFFLLCGSSIAFIESIRKVKDAMQEYSPTILFLVPAVMELIYSRLEQSVKKQKKETQFKVMKKVAGFLADCGIDIRKKVFKDVHEGFGNNFKLAFVGAAPCPKKLIQDFYDLGIKIYQGYGMTETSPVISCENDFKQKIGSVGTPITGVEVKIDPIEDTKKIIKHPKANAKADGKNVIGEVLVKGDNVFKGYLQDPEKTNETIIDGWCHTGDIGYIDNDGFLFLTGRKKDMIVLSNGKKIFPEEIEQVLSKIPYIKEVMVYGKPENEDDVKLVAKIVLDQEILDNQLKEENVEVTRENENHKIWDDIKKVNETFPKYKYIKDVYVTSQELIKTTTMKIKRYQEIEKTEQDLKDNIAYSVKD